MKDKKPRGALKAAALIFALAGMTGIGAQAAILTQNLLIYSDVLLLASFYILYQAYVKCLMHRKTRGFYFLTVGLSVCYSFFLIWGGLLDKDLELEGWKFFCAVLFLAAALYPALDLLTGWIDQRKAENGSIKNRKKALAICSVIVTVVWMCAYLAMFPGVYATDAPTWYYEFSNPDVPISSQWSPLYCAVFYGLVKTGEKLFGNYNAGFALFSFVQMLGVLAAVIRMLSFFCQRFSILSVIAVTAFFSLIPTHVILSLTSAQDSMFAVCMSMCLIHIYEMLCNPQLYFAEKRNLLKLALWLVLFCAVRNNGLYALLVMSVFATFFMKTYRKQLLTVLCCVIATVMIYSGPGYHMMGVEKGTVNRWMLSLPLQQMANAYNFGQDRLSEQQISKMQKYLTDEGWRNYQIHISLSDYVVRGLDYESFTKDPTAFLALYADIFFSVPDCYFQGLGLQTFGLWYPNKNYTDGRIYHPYISYMCYDETMALKDVYGLDFSVERSSLLPIYDNFLGWLYGKGTDQSGAGGNLFMAFTNIPGLGTFSKAGIYCWMLIYLFFYFIYRQKKELLLLVGLGIGVYLTVALSPVIMYRYCAPVIFSAPLFVATLFGPWKYSGNYGKVRRNTLCVK